MHRNCTIHHKFESHTLIQPETSRFYYQEDISFNTNS